MPLLISRDSCRTPAAAAIVAIALTAIGCSKTESAQARGRDAAAKPVTSKPSRKRRSSGPSIWWGRWRPSIR